MDKARRVNSIFCAAFVLNFEKTLLFFTAFLVDLESVFIILGTPKIELNLHLQYVKQTKSEVFEILAEIIPVTLCPAICQGLLILAWNIYFISAKQDFRDNTSTVSKSPKSIFPWQKQRGIQNHFKHLKLSFLQSAVNCYRKK